MEMERVKATNVLKRHRQAVNDGFKIIEHEGGSRSSKTWSILQFFLLDHAATGEELTLTIVREKLTWIKTTILKDFAKLVDKYGLYVYPRINPRAHDQVYKVLNMEFAFFGVDYGEKLHGRTQDWFWMNEAIESKKSDFDQLEMRTNIGGVIDYNPIDDQGWVFDIQQRPDVKVIKSTMLDNPFLPQTIIKKIKGYKPTPENIENGTADEYMWQVYGLGNRAKLKGVIFKKWDIVDSIPKKARFLGYGLDFGYSNHPAAFVALYKMNNELYWDEIFYETGLTNYSPDKSDDTIVRRFQDLEIDEEADIVGDSSEPKSIDEISRNGFNIVGAEKGRDSINFGIGVLQGYKMHITKRSVNLEKELRRYKWAENRNGESLKKPIDEWNHAIDACRYIAVAKLASQGEIELLSRDELGI